MCPSRHPFSVWCSQHVVLSSRGQQSHLTLSQNRKLILFFSSLSGQKCSEERRFLEITTSKWSRYHIDFSLNWWQGWNENWTHIDMKIDLHRFCFCTGRVCCFELRNFNLFNKISNFSTNTWKTADVFLLQ